MDKQQFKVGYDKDGDKYKLLIEITNFDSIDEIKKEAEKILKFLSDDGEYNLVH